jgi:hypothetical protein
MVAFEDPIIMIGGDTATADIAGQETIVRSDGNSGSVFNTIFSLVHQDGIWKISKVDRLTDAEIDGLWCRMFLKLSKQTIWIFF